MDYLLFIVNCKHGYQADSTVGNGVRIQCYEFLAHKKRDLSLFYIVGYVVSETSTSVTDSQKVWILGSS